jgi:carboxylate-amine ligase
MGKKRERPLKRSKTGIEAEFHIIDDKGRISNRAHKVISAIKDTHKNIDVSKEVGMNMIEFGCYPDVPAVNPTIDLIDSIQKSMDICREEGLKLYPFATYPGKFQPRFSRGQQYDIKKKIFGYPKMENAARATGFHHHYSLPKGVFDANEKLLKLMRKSKLERSMMASYNFEIAADPALTLYAQSSPLFEGQYLAKDSRTLIYRGGKKLKYMDGVYAKLQQIGGLPPYKQTVTDLLISLSKRWMRWEKEVRRADPSVDFNVLYPFKLDIGWHPVKINKHGTLEQRGMDINYMSVVVAITVMLKYCLKKIQRDFIEVIPADFAIEEAFKLEGNVLYIPPHTYVRNHLQLWSAYNGYERAEMHNYAKRLFSFTRSVTPRSYYRIIRPVYDMIESRKSVSDRILAYAKKKGYVADGRIGNTDASMLASYYADTFPKDIEKTREALLRVASL